MITLHIIRHGETDSNARGHRTGWSNPALNAEGIKQAEHLRKWFDQHQDLPLFSSDLRRAEQTAEIASGRKPVMTDLLREQNWQTETQSELSDRCQLFINSIANSEVVVVTHGRTARLLEAILSCTPLSKVPAYKNGEIRTVSNGLSLF